MGSLGTVNRITPTEQAVNILATEIQKDLNGYYKDWDIENWAEYLDATGRDSADFKEDAYYLLNHFDWRSVGLDPMGPFTDDLEILDDNVPGGVLSYRKLMDLVRKRVFKKEEEEVL